MEDDTTRSRPARARRSPAKAGQGEAVPAQPDQSTTGSRPGGQRGRPVPPPPLFVEPKVPAPRGADPTPPESTPQAEPGEQPAPKAARKAAPAAKKAAAAKQKSTAGEPVKKPAKKAARKAPSAAKATPPAKTSPTETPAPAAKSNPAKTSVPAKKATRTKKTTPPKAETTPAEAEPISREAEPATTEGPPTPVEAERAPVPVPSAEPVTVIAPETFATWARLKERPEYTPELLALAAVHRIGPQARDFVSLLRSTYPGASPAAIARYTTARLTRPARYTGFVAGLVGIPGHLLDLLGVAWSEARVVLHIAAAYGWDPVDPERAADLLVLRHVHPSREVARTALRAATTGDRVPLAGGVAWRVAQLAALPLGGRLGRRLATKLVPGAGALLGIVGNTATLDDVAARAEALYRQGPDAAS